MQASRIRSRAPSPPQATTTVRTPRGSSSSHPPSSASPAELKAAGVRPTLKPSLTIETFQGDWQKEWFTYQPEDWARRTHKIYNPLWKAPPRAKLALDVRCEKPNKLVIGIDNYAAETNLAGGQQWHTIVLSPADFRDALDQPLREWSCVKELRFGPHDAIRTGRGPQSKLRRLGGPWQGPPPELRNLRWL